MTHADLFSRDEPRHAQEEAADPTVSVFVTANAGSGKTKTLIDRVARLLLAKARPETILCITYTKAAASEMQRRLYDTLGDWSVATDAKLRQDLGKLRSRAPASFDHQDLSEARGLFAAALETPGGLKIQTIHAFCEKVLKRFPLEAGVPPGFRVMDEAAAAAVAAAARKAVAHHVLNIPGPLADAYGRLAVSLDFRRFQAMFAEFETRRSALREFFGPGGLAGAIAWVWRTVDIEPGTDPDDLARAAMAGIDRDLYRRCAETLKAGGKQDGERAAVLGALAQAAAPALEDAVALFFTKDDEPRKWVETGKLLRAEPALQAFLLAEQARLHNVRERMRAAQVGRDSTDALSLAHAYLDAYAIEKAASGALDFADLVEKTCALLRDRPAAAWVLYKLDGGVDHILLDEAQDTAPEQWAIVDALTEDFFAGAGRRPAQALRRGVFVVGDRKQSIYSFQGARPELLAERFEQYSARVAGADDRVKEIPLLESWRSTPQVLQFVDAVFTPSPLQEAVQPGAPVRHDVAEPRREHAGCVDLWEMEVDPGPQDQGAWDLPLDVEPRDSGAKKLARRIAAEIRDLIARGEAVHDKAHPYRLRPAHAGDVLILVRRRGALFEEILRALKLADLPVAGADRLSLSSHIIFDDLLALARFALFPDDDLTLAGLLKSPFCGLDDDSLYTLAHGREGRLWRTLRDRADEDALWRDAARFLRLALDTAKAARPFEFFVRLVEHTGADGRSMRQRLLTRLGPEARDALDEFLNQALAAEDRGAHDLETLADELSGLEIVVKREMEGVRAEVRVMTAHGAKGLEAPIVFLPETNLQNTSRGSPLLRVERGGKEGVGFLWSARSANDCPATSDARRLRAEREDAEAYRLLYVALTRARDRLVLCGRRAERTDPGKLRGWWGAVRDALSHAGIEGDVRELEHPDGARFRRYGPDPRRVRARPPGEAVAFASPVWAATPATAEAYARYASPSDLGEGAVAATASPLAESAGLGRFRRGDLIHRLLQLLPDIPAAGWAEGAADLLARERDLTPDQRAEMAAAALAVLDDPRFAGVFGPGSRPEVAIAGTAASLPPSLRISGRIDRLVVLPDRVLVVDFKTNRPSPDAIEAADPAYLRQMALYAAVLGEIFPGRRIEAAIVWTDGPKLMPVPENLIARTLADLRRDG
ncbi:MAG: double-strand break repair helicase AddA [Phenylobacterium sp.]|uniref:double-strand break repair helicase AddA n=1 Tax=Phenylobacterium sp. TaxID=1871053 RepID=UPI001A472327|nr:double-strand break repair helicase AddA [Phenylobacterium sp.]MBL8557065.1 double-strand break repair helicase AddA [Phenylobacterium sp.]